MEGVEADLACESVDGAVSVSARGPTSRLARRWETDGMWSMICSSASLSTSGSASRRWAHVFRRTALPELDTASFRVRTASKFICVYIWFWRAGVRSSEWSWAPWSWGWVWVWECSSWQWLCGMAADLGLEAAGGE